MSRIEIAQPYVDVEASLANLKESLESGQLVQGKQVAAAEQSLSEVLESEYTAMTSSGTSAIKAALIASICRVRNINPAYVDRNLPDLNIVIPAFSFIASLNAVMQIGAETHIVDINESDYCINPDEALQAINENTVAVMPVDLYGQPADTRDYERYLELSGIALVRDSAQAVGAKLDGESLVEHADAVCLSFYPSKNIAAPEGGAVLTNDQRIDQIVRVYRNQGMSRRYVYDMSGDNLRMTDVHAAILRPNIGKVAIFAEIRAQNAAKLSEGLSQIEGITVPLLNPDREHVWHQYTIMVEPEFGMNREQLAQALDAKDIGTGIFYPNTLVDQPTYFDNPRVKIHSTKVAEKVAAKVLSLPVHPGLSDNDLNRIVDEIGLIQKGNPT